MLATLVSAFQGCGTAGLAAVSTILQKRGRVCSGRGLWWVHGGWVREEARQLPALLPKSRCSNQNEDPEDPLEIWPFFLSFTHCIW